MNKDNNRKPALPFASSPLCVFPAPGTCLFFYLHPAWAGGGGRKPRQIPKCTETLCESMHKLIDFASLFVFTAVPRVPKLSILMQALFCAHWEHSRSTQTHQREETQEEHHGMGILYFIDAIHKVNKVCHIFCFCCIRKNRRRTSCAPCRPPPPPSWGPWTQPS